MHNIDKNQNLGSLEIYRDPSGNISVQLLVTGNNIWMTQKAIAELFGTAVSTVNYHIKEIYKSGELDEASTIRKIRIVRMEGRREVARWQQSYDLDTIISVGYRVNSKRATAFRIWATDKLRKYLVDGYVANQARLEQLGKILNIIGQSSNELLSGTATVLNKYMSSLKLLNEYDNGSLRISPKHKPNWTLTLGEARQIISQVKEAFPMDNLAGVERGNALESIIKSVYQSFDGEELYKTTEEKAANLLYLVVKDHPLSDGNKRSAALLFVTFLERNGLLYNSGSQLRISNNALSALTLLVATSSPKEKNQLIDLIICMID